MGLKRYGNLIVDPQMVKVASVYPHPEVQPAAVYRYPERSPEDIESMRAILESQKDIQVITPTHDIEVQPRELAVVVLVDNLQINAAPDDVKRLLDDLCGSGGYY